MSIKTDMIALQREIFTSLYKEFPEASQQSDKKPLPNLRVKISQITVKGEVFVKFSEDVYQFDKLQSRKIEVIQTSDESASQDGLDIKDVKLMKPWVEVRLLAGLLSEASDLKFDTEA